MSVASMARIPTISIGKCVKVRRVSRVDLKKHSQSQVLLRRINSTRYKLRSSFNKTHPHRLSLVSPLVYLAFSAM